MTDAATPNPVRVNLTDRLPAKISPSRMKDFTQCPKLFYYKTLLGLRDPATIHTAVGVLAHYALEMIFDHPRDDRNPKNAIPYVRVHWDEIRTKPDYAVLEEELGADGVEEMLVKAEGHVERYFDIERAWNFDPEGREVYLSEKVGDATVHGFIVTN